MTRVCPGHRRVSDHHQQYQQQQASADYYSGYDQTYDYAPSSYYYNYYQGRSLQDSFLPRMGSLLNRSV